MNPPSGPQPRQRRYSVRQQARLDAGTHAKLEALATALHRKRSAILRYVMQWALAHTNGWTVDQVVPAVAHPVSLLMDPELYQQVQDAADAHRTSVAAWLRHAMRQVAIEHFPASWRAGAITIRSHEAGQYDRKFGLRLDAVTSHKLEAFTQTFDRSAAAIIRQLILQAMPQQFPQSWHMAAAERRVRRVRERGRDPS
jgi:predicted transcriptional regulator